MEQWKRAVMYGSFAAGAVFLFSGRKSAAAVAAGIGLATLATEYPDQFERLWDSAPEYLERGNQIMDAVGRVLDRLGHQATLEAERGWRAATR
jgi:hypothetical protein